MTKCRYWPKKFNGKVYRFASAHTSRERAEDVARLRRRDNQWVRLVELSSKRSGKITAVYYRPKNAITVIRRGSRRGRR